MKALISGLQEASGPERLTRTPHTCPHGWTQIQVKKGTRHFYTCKPPSAVKLAKQGADPLTLAWQSVKAGKWDRAVASISLALAKAKGRDRSMLQDIQNLVDGEVDGDGLGKRAVVNHTKPLFKKLGVDISSPKRSSR